MNAITKTEARAIETAAPLEVADPTRNLILVPLSQLLPRRSARNARKTARVSIPELAASIARIGLLQNLIVILAADGEHYEVVAGDRRLTALKLLAKKKRIGTDHEVPCLLVTDGSARTISLAENLLREQMHPADQFEAFAALVKEGRPVEDIAADFGVTPLVVQRRLKLANVSPRLLTDYRAGDVTLEQLMALAVTDDHAAQDAAYYDAPTWQRDPAALRERLTGGEINAARDPLARFVGVDAYEQGGGIVRRDLFREDVYLADAALLESLARDRLADVAEKVRAEGWAWVDVAPRVTHADLQAFRRATREQREPKPAEAKRIAKLEARAQVIEAQLDAEEDMDEVAAQALYDEHDRISAALAAIADSLQTYSAKVRAFAGAVVSVDTQGDVVVHRGLLQEDVARVLRTLERDGASPEDVADAAHAASAAAPAKGGMSEALARRLSAHRTAALQVELARRPQVALAALVSELAGSLLLDGEGTGLPIGVRASEPAALTRVADDLAQSDALRTFDALRERWRQRLPEDGDGLFDALLATSVEQLVELLAVCVAATVNVVTPNEHSENADVLARAVALDMRAWWTATAAGYFQHIPKAAIVTAAPQFAPNYGARLSVLRKGELAATAERLAAGTGWLPPMFARQSAWIDPPPAEGDGDERPEVEAAPDTPHALAA